MWAESPAPELLVEPPLLLAAKQDVAEATAALEAAELTLAGLEAELERAGGQPPDETFAQALEVARGEEARGRSRMEEAESGLQVKVYRSCLGGQLTSCQGVAGS